MSKPDFTKPLKVSLSNNRPIPLRLNRLTDDPDMPHDWGRPRQSNLQLNDDCEAREAQFESFYGRLLGTRHTNLPDTGEWGGYDRPRRP